MRIRLLLLLVAALAAPMQLPARDHGTEARQVAKSQAAPALGTFAGTWEGAIAVSAVGFTFNRGCVVRIASDEKTVTTQWADAGDGVGVITEKAKAQRVGDTLTWNTRGFHKNGVEAWRGTCVVRLRGPGSALLVRNDQTTSGPGKGIRSSYSGTLSRK